jgi:DNA-binding response OmpR family regulator
LTDVDGRGSTNDLPGSQVLVVDDDERVRDLVVFALPRAGFDVIEATSGDAVMPIVETQTVGVVVLDVSMPGMSGMDVVRLMRRRPDTATLPVIRPNQTRGPRG